MVVEDLCREAGISMQTYCRWCKKPGGLIPSEMKRLKSLEEDNVRLKSSPSVRNLRYNHLGLSQ